MKTNTPSPLAALLTLPLLGVTVACAVPGPSPSSDTDDLSDTDAESSGGPGGSGDTGERPPTPQDDGTGSPDDGADTSSSGAAGTDDGGGSGDTGGDETTGETTGEPAECPGAMVCTPAAPEGWSGPYELSEAAGEAACTGFYSDLVQEGGSFPISAEASCECSCEVSSASCNPIGGLEYYAGGCDENWEEWFLLDPSASVGEAAPAGVRAYAYTGPMGGQNQAACQSQLDAATFPAPSFELAAVACEFPGAQPECDGGACMPEAEAGDLCIVQEGDVECPAGPYQDRRVHYQAIEDTRACGCGCEADVACDNDLVILQLLASNGAVSAVPVSAEGVCTPVGMPGTILSANFIPAAPVATCEAETTALGGIEAAQPFTACCL